MRLTPWRMAPRSDASRALDRPMARREDDDLALLRGDRLAP